MSNTARHTGIVLWFKAGKGKGRGFGFIGRPGQADLFVHVSQLRSGFEKEDRELYEGDQVSFEIGTGPDKRPVAENVIIQLRGSSQPPTLNHRHD